MWHIVWLKRDLRVCDHLPFAAAAATGGLVVPLYVIEPDYWQLPDVSCRHWLFVRDCLIELRADLQKIGSNLWVRRGSVTDVLYDLLQRAGKIKLYSHEETGNNWTFARDQTLANFCRQQDIAWHEFPNQGVIRRLRNRDDWAQTYAANMQNSPLEAPLHLPTPPDLPIGEIPPSDHLLFRPLNGVTVQAGGRQSAINTLNSFLQTRANDYLKTISRPGISARHSSRLSAALAYGSISAREVTHLTQKRLIDLAAEDRPNAKFMVRNLRAFLSRLAWRSHFMQKLEQQPAIEYRAMHPLLDNLRERGTRRDWLDDWYRGRTGYPLVDACMRSLHENGWLNFRMRALVTSFASYHLWLDWRDTGPLLAGLFTDYEPGIHYSQLQMQSGTTGINAVRMYNPIKQSIDWAADGKFIRRFVPELRDLPIAYLHEPWRAPDRAKDYPPPLVDHSMAVKLARANLSLVWKNPAFREQAQKVWQKLGSRSRLSAKPRAREVDKRQMNLKF